jgi:hypothetical protein
MLPETFPLLVPVLGSSVAGLGALALFVATLRINPARRPPK